MNHLKIQHLRGKGASHEKLSHFGNLNGRAAMPFGGAGSGADGSRRPRRDGEHGWRLAAAGNSNPAPAGHQSPPDHWGNNNRQ